MSERNLQATDLRAQIVLEGNKGLVLVNGAGAAALAAFLQAVWDKADAIALRGPILASIAVLALGVLLAGVSFFPRYMTGFDPRSNVIGASPWWRAWVGLLAGSAVCFFVGMLVMVLGVYTAISALHVRVPCVGL